MGVYNPKATMPRSCFDCGCNDGFTCEYLETDCYIADYAQTERIHPDCPLVEVKVPHGRLVDEDAIGWRYEEERAHNQVVEVARQSGCDSPACQYYDAYYDGILTMTGKIRFAPTIIEEEV